MTLEILNFHIGIDFPPYYVIYKLSGVEHLQIYSQNCA